MNLSEHGQRAYAGARGAGWNPTDAYRFAVADEHLGRAEFNDEIEFGWGRTRTSRSRASPACPALRRSCASTSPTVTGRSRAAPPASRMANASAQLAA